MGGQGCSLDESILVNNVSCGLMLMLGCGGAETLVSSLAWVA